MLFLLSTTSAVAQFISLPTDARSCALGGCMVDNANRRYATISYRQGFALSAMSSKRINIGWNLGSIGWISAGYDHFGDSDFAEQQLIAECGMNVDESVTLSVEGRYCHLGTNDVYYDAEQWMAVAARATLKVNPRLSLSALVGTKPWDDSHPWRMHLNAVCVLSSGLLAVAEIEREDLLRFRCGAEYCYREHFFFRAGLATRPVTLAFGVGLRYGNYSIDIAAEAHNTLGITPQISIMLCL